MGVMKVEIDLNDILGDEYGSETLQESIRRQVIDSVSKTVKDGVGKRINEAVSNTIQQEINNYLKIQMPILLANIMDAEYIPVDNYGHRKEPTNFRKELVDHINKNMTYKPSRYDSDKNSFTRAVDECVAGHLKTFKEEFSKKVDSTFTEEAMAFAQQKLRERLGIK